jgi:hypothetical protein
LPRYRVKTLAAFLDFGACANTAFDNKDHCPHEWRITSRLLEDAGMGSSAREYLRRLTELETNRPLPGGDHWHFEKAVLYREEVVRLSLGMAAQTANAAPSLDEGIRATYYADDLHILFRIVMQCQIIDDVLDYAEDSSAGLPSFLTSSKSLSRGFERTRLASLGYAEGRDLARTAEVSPLRSALNLVSLCTKLVLGLTRWRESRRFKDGNRYCGGRPGMTIAIVDECLN